MRELRSARICGICHETRNNAVCPGSCPTHFFCEACLIQWACVQSTCPLCRAAFATIVTPHGYELAQQVRKTALSPLHIYSQSRPDDPPTVVQMHISWSEHIDDVLHTLNTLPWTAAVRRLGHLRRAEGGGSGGTVVVM